MRCELKGRVERSGGSHGNNSAATCWDYAPWCSYSFTQLSITTVKVCTWTTSDTCHRETLYSGIAVLCYWVISENLDRATKLHQEANEASAGSLVTDFEQVQPARTHWIYIVWTAELNTLRPVDWGIQQTAENSGRHQTSQVSCTEDFSPFCWLGGLSARAAVIVSSRCVFSSRRIGALCFCLLWSRASYQAFSV